MSNNIQKPQNNPKAIKQIRTRIMSALSLDSDQNLRLAVNGICRNFVPLNIYCTLLLLLNGVANARQYG